MTRALTASTLIFTTALFALPAAAGDMDKMAGEKEKAPESRTTVMVKTIDADGAVGDAQFRVDSPRETAVLGALDVQTTEAYVVEDEAGNLFLNHVLTVADLPDPTLDPEVLDTVTLEHRGMTFTNRLVRHETVAATHLSQ